MAQKRKNFLSLMSILRKLSSTFHDFSLRKSEHPMWYFEASICWMSGFMVRISLAFSLYFWSTWVGTLGARNPGARAPVAPYSNPPLDGATCCPNWHYNYVGKMASVIIRNNKHGHIIRINEIDGASLIYESRTISRAMSDISNRTADIINTPFPIVFCYLRCTIIWKC